MLLQGQKMFPLMLLSCSGYFPLPFHGDLTSKLVAICCNSRLLNPIIWFWFSVVLVLGRVIIKSYSDTVELSYRCVPLRSILWIRKRVEMLHCLVKGYDI